MVWDAGIEPNGTEGKNFYIPMSNRTGIVRSPFEYPQYYLVDPIMFKVLAIYMFFLICTGTPINGLTLLVTAQNKKLRQPLNYILVNLAVAGLIMCAFGFTITITSAINGYFILGATACAIEGFMATLGGQREIERSLIVPLEVPSYDVKCYLFTPSCWWNLSFWSFSVFLHRWNCIMVTCCPGCWKVHRCLQTYGKLQIHWHSRCSWSHFHLDHGFCLRCTPSLWLVQVSYWSTKNLLKCSMVPWLTETCSLFLQRYLPEGMQCSCGPDYYTLAPGYNNESYVIYMFSCHFFVPVVTIFFTYGSLVLTVKAVSRRNL